MLARRIFTLGSLAFAIGVGIFACVGDEPGIASSEKATGERLGPCFSDGKCKEGLVCRDGEICLTPDEPKPIIDAGGVVNDADGSTPASDSGVDAGACTPTGSPTHGPSCGATPCPLNETCCSSVPRFCGVSQEPNCAGANQWACEEDSQCGNLDCCVLAVPTTEGTTSCAFKNKNGTSKCVPPGDCPSAAAPNGRRVCASDFECSTGKCRPEEVATSLGFPVVVKFCAP